MFVFKQKDKGQPEGLFNFEKKDFSGSGAMVYPDGSLTVLANYSKNV